jgi:hypothetical protein
MSYTAFVSLKKKKYIILYMKLLVKHSLKIIVQDLLNKNIHDLKIHTYFKLQLQQF